jgi:hypothetical protein
VVDIDGPFVSLIFHGKPLNDQSGQSVSSWKITLEVNKYIKCTTVDGCEILHHQKDG